MLDLNVLIIVEVGLVCCVNEYGFTDMCLRRDISLCKKVTCTHPWTLHLFVLSVAVSCFVSWSLFILLD